ncbi:MAG: M48 family metallopeptidase [Candidatus Hodarchaeales archaeon]
MATQKTTKFLKWFNLTIFVVLNILVVFITSLIPENIFELLEQGIQPTIYPNLGNFVVGLIIILVLQMLYLYYRLLKLYRNEEMFRIYPPTEGTIDVISTSKVPISEIVTMITEIGSKLNVSVKAVFITRQTIPEIFSFDIIPFPRKLSIMVLSENAMEITSKKELRCLIAHEIGHIKNHNSHIRLLQRIARPFLFIAYIYPFILIMRELATNSLYSFDLTKIFVYLLILLTMIVIVFILTSIQSYFIDTANRQAVFEADSVAVEIENRNAMINMLVKLGQRSEALDVLLEKIMWLEKREKKKDYQIDLRQVLGILDLFPKGEISEHTAREMAPEIYLRSRFMVLEKFYHCKIPEDVMNTAIKEASAQLIKIHEKEIEADELKKKEMEKRVQKTIDWREVDVDGNLNLDDEEIKEFIKILKENPSKLLFENEFATHGMFKNYPSFRDRILFLMDNAEQKSNTVEDSVETSPDSSDQVAE